MNKLKQFFCIHRYRELYKENQFGFVLFGTEQTVFICEKCGKKLEVEK